VFSNGVIEKDGKILVYYGAADETSCVAITDIDSLLGTMSPIRTSNRLKAS
jgi:predicted GH43/DUF377 family glycosyl hydrolase